MQDDIGGCGKMQGMQGDVEEHRECGAMQGSVGGYRECWRCKDAKGCEEIWRCKGMQGIQQGCGEVVGVQGCRRYREDAVGCRGM